MLFLPFLVEICNFLADTKGDVSYCHQNHIGGLIVSLLTFSVVDHGFTVGSNQRLQYWYVLLLYTQH